MSSRGMILCVLCEKTQFSNFFCQTCTIMNKIAFFQHIAIMDTQKRHILIDYFLHEKFF